MSQETQLAGPVEQPEDVREHFERSKDSLIMMVDDEPIVMGVVQTFLEDWGYNRFITCEDSTRAIEIIKKESPDVLLLDLVMPEVTGFDILFELSRDEATRHLPIVVLTSSGDAETKLRALEMGATDFLAKPVDPSELTLRLRNTLTVKAYQDRLAKFDHLTGLANRKMFQERMQWAFRRYSLHQQELVVILMGLDRFKLINDTLGADIGDEILIQVAARIKDLIEEKGLKDATAARLGGDEFAMLFDANSGSPIESLASTLLAEIKEPYFVSGKEVFVTASAGISRTTDIRTPDELLSRASVAAKQAKHLGLGKLQLYSAEIDAEARELLQLESELRHALENDELELYYQPKIESKSRKIFGMEALLRWRKQDGVMISPARFIPIAEESGLIVPIGAWILKEACKNNKQLESIGIKCKVSVNVSAHQLIDPDIFIAISEALDASKLAPEQLVIEITESVMMGDVERSLGLLHSIQDLGCSLSVDDFGTGYSSLSYLKRFPIAELKIDQSFLVDLPEKAEDAAIVRAIIALAHALDLTVTAEGVETQEQVDYLVEHDCELLQGYFFSRPIPFPDLPAFFRNHQHD
jgi:diguanylate cyclase (GGDEF)-like protein